MLNMGAKNGYINICCYNIYITVYKGEVKNDRLHITTKRK
jgi:hypothetical protein